MHRIKSPLLSYKPNKSPIINLGHYFPFALSLSSILSLLSAPEALPTATASPPPVEPPETSSSPVTTLLDLSLSFGERKRERRKGRKKNKEEKGKTLPCSVEQLRVRPIFHTRSE